MKNFFYITVGFALALLAVASWQKHPAPNVSYSVYQVNDCIVYKNAEFHKPTYQIQIVGDKNYFISDYPNNYNYVEISFKTGNTEYTKTHCNY